MLKALASTHNIPSPCASVSAFSAAVRYFAGCFFAYFFIFTRINPGQPPCETMFV
jgi:hypothetical protein